MDTWILVILYLYEHKKEINSSLEFGGHLINMHRVKNSLFNFRFEVLIVVLVKIQVFCHVTQCCGQVHSSQCFKGSVVPSSSGSSNRRTRILVGLCDPHGEGTMIFRNSLNCFSCDIVSHYREFEIFMFCIVQRTDVRGY